MTEIFKGKFHALYNQIGLYDTEDNNFPRSAEETELIHGINLELSSLIEEIFIPGNLIGSIQG